MTLSRIVAALALISLCGATASLPAQADELQEVQALAKQGNNTLALERANAFLAKQPKEKNMRFLKGVILNEQGRIDEAIKVFTALTEDYPELPEPYNNLAVLYASQRQYDKARQELEMAIRTHPSYATAHENLGDIYAKLASEAYDKALSSSLEKPNPAGQAKLQTKLALLREILPSSTSRQPSAKASTKPAVAEPSPPAKVAAQPPAPKAPEKVAEKPVEKPAEKPAEKAPEKSPEKTEKPKHDVSQAITATLHQWAQAWSSKNVNAYLAHYAPDFKTPKGESRSEWEKFRRDRLAAPKKIQVGLSAIKVVVKDDTHAQATFRQSYKADTLNTSATKTVVLIRSGDKWLIQQERVGL